MNSHWTASMHRLGLLETNLFGDSWKSRPPIIDHGNSSYTLKLLVHPQFADEYNLSIILSHSFEGLKYLAE